MMWMLALLSSSNSCYIQTISHSQGAVLTDNLFSKKFNREVGSQVEFVHSIKAISSY